MLKYYFSCITINNGDIKSFNNLLMAWTKPQTCKLLVYIRCSSYDLNIPNLTLKSSINVNCIDKSICYIRNNGS